MRTHPGAKPALDNGPGPHWRFQPTRKGGKRLSFPACLPLQYGFLHVECQQVHEGTYHGCQGERLRPRSDRSGAAVVDGLAYGSTAIPKGPSGEKM